MFWVRFRSSVVLVVVLAASLSIGGDLLFGLLSITALAGLYELYKVVGMQKSIPAAAGYLSAAAYCGFIYFKQTELLFPLCIIFLLALMGTYVFCFPKYTAAQISMIYISLFYIAVMLLFVYQVRVSRGGEYLVWLIFIGSWGSDTCAYLVGMSIGKHKLAKTLSPKKSVEGAVGGIAGAALIGFVFALVLEDKIEGISNPAAAFAVITGCSSVISQIGDLTASAIKRNYNVKDYGKLIPGHGGILDRFDSVIFTAPIVYFLSLLF